MKAVFAREMDACRHGLTGSIFTAFILLFAGIYLFVINLSAGYANFEYSLQNMSFIFLVAIPVLTMRVFADEKRQRTDMLLYALPLSMTKIVLGKYLALLCTLLAPTAVLALYPLLLLPFGAVPLANAYCAVFGFYLLGAALCAVGMFISSVTENQAIAAGICFVALLINYFSSSLGAYIDDSALYSGIAAAVCIVLLALCVGWMTKNRFMAFIVGASLLCVLMLCYILFSSSFAGMLGSVFTGLSLFEHFYTFTQNTLDFTGVVFFCSVMGVFVFLTVQSMEKRRWS